MRFECLSIISIASSFPRNPARAEAPFVAAQAARGQGIPVKALQGEIFTSF